MFAWYDGLRYKIGLYLTQTEERNADDKLQKALEAVLQHEKRESSQQYAPIEHAVVDRQVRRADGERDGAQENDAHAA